MTTVDFEIFEAFRAMNAPEDVARNLAVAIARRDSHGLAILKDDVHSMKADLALVKADTGRLKTDLAVLKWMVGVIAAVAVSFAVKNFLH